MTVSMGHKVTALERLPYKTNIHTPPGRRQQNTTQLTAAAALFVVVIMAVAAAVEELLQQRLAGVAHHLLQLVREAVAVLLQEVDDGVRHFTCGPRNNKQHAYGCGTVPRRVVRCVDACVRSVTQCVRASVRGVSQ